MVTDVEWAAFFPAAVLLAATPGANQLLALRNGLRHGPRAAVGASLGRFGAFALMVAAVAAGLGALLTASEVAFSVVKWGGVAYLAWLGVRTVATAGRPADEERRGSRAEGTVAEDRSRAEGAVAQDRSRAGGAAPQGKGRSSGAAPALRGRQPVSARRLARQEFIVAAANPKALILFTVFLPQFLSRDAAHVVLPLCALGAAYIAVEFCCACGYAALGGRLKALGITRRVRRRLDGATGAGMLGLAGWLATEGR
ncbi:homoserine transporter [Streptomyces rimosus subsp. pseudoverticillatus]|uniref:LysE family translocator n=1 Tax=Streptomyces rimosus TaxID=1927 RepID=UPI0006B273B9|nr:LysE family translocator [Streptomyces rimosus]KOU00333.1 homoserine transporter [Streptomyces rimosus subsp. pseudoverticillatus]